MTEGEGGWKEVKGNVREEEEMLKREEGYDKEGERREERERDGK